MKYVHYNKHRLWFDEEETHSIGPHCSNEQQAQAWVDGQETLTMVLHPKGEAKTDAYGSTRRLHIMDR